MAAEGKGSKFLFGLFVAFVVVIIGFLAYGAYLGVNSVATVVDILIIGVGATILVSLFIKGKTGVWDVEDLIMGAGAVLGVYAYFIFLHPIIFGDTFSLVPAFKPILASIAKGSFSVI